MGMSIDDLVKEIEEEKTKEASVSDEKVESLSEAVANRALEKVAEKRNKKDKSKKDTGRKEEAELSPEEMLENAGEGLSEEKIKELKEKLTERQNEKIAGIKKVFEENEKTAQAKLFEKIASYQLATNPKIVVDKKFQQYETLDGQKVEPEMFFDTQGDEEVNNFFRS